MTPPLPDGSHPSAGNGDERLRHATHHGQLPDGTGFDIESHLQPVQMPPTDFERDKSLDFLDDKDIQEQTKLQAIEFAGVLVRRINAWVVSDLSPLTIAQRALAVALAMRREDLPEGKTTLPELAESLGILKQGLHYHTKAFRELFGIHLGQRSAECSRNQSIAAKESWARRKAEDAE